MRQRAVGLIVIFALGILSTPLPASAKKQEKVYRIGWLGHSYSAFNKVFMDELRHLGWVKGRNFVLERRSRGWKKDRIPRLATELVQLNVDLIITVNTVDTQAAKNATTTTPIVFTMVGDPVGDGFVKSLAKPGGNVTGVSDNSLEISGKVLQLLKEAVPTASRVAYLYNPAHGRLAHRLSEEMQGASQTLGVDLQSLKAKGPKDIKLAFKAVDEEQAQGLIVISAPPLNTYVPQIVDLAITRSLPMMVLGPAYWTRSGALMSYAPEYPPLFRRAAHLVDKILRGAKPDDLPVELPNLYNFVINLETARQLGLEIPESLLVRATQLVEVGRD